MGKKLINKKTGQVEFHIYKDVEELRKHYRRKHYVCKKGCCEDLAFPDNAQLAHHCLSVHGEKMTVQLDFKYSDDEEDDMPDDYDQRQRYYQ